MNKRYVYFMLTNFDITSTPYFRPLAPADKRVVKIRAASGRPVNQLHSDTISFTAHQDASYSQIRNCVEPAEPCAGPEVVRGAPPS